MEPNHPIVGYDAWMQAQAAFLRKEKEFTKMRDELARQRRALPWTPVEKTYSFETAAGKRTLADLFHGKHQLLVYHFMFAPDGENGCEGCSFISDHMNAALPHLAQRDVSYVAVSRAPLAKLDAFKKRMGWSFEWVSSGNGDFNYDFHVSHTPKQVEAKDGIYNFERTHQIHGEDTHGISALIGDDQGRIYRTYSSFARGPEPLITTYMALDLLPKGREEEGFKVHPMEWVRRHDEYEHAKHEGPCCK